MRVFAFTVLLALASCAPEVPYRPEPPSGEFQWKNDKPHTDSEFNVAKNACIIESEKVPIPSPSCTAVAPRDTSGYPSGLQGFYASRPPPPPECNYSSVDSAIESKHRVFESCLVVRGWNKVWVPYNTAAAAPTSKYTMSIPSDARASAREQCAIISEWAASVASGRDAGASKSYVETDNESRFKSGDRNKQAYEIDKNIIYWVYSNPKASPEATMEVWVNECLDKLASAQSR